jgi:predicted regulator of Ras-like GTPase activity (Roadblock/LC7/MglB family)
MSRAQFVVHQEEFQKLEESLERLQLDASARAVFLIDKNGQQISACGDTANFDTTSLASLTAGNVAATDGLAKLIGEREFSVLFHEGERDHIHISVVADRAILVVIFDERSSLGLVRLRVKRASAEISELFDQMDEARQLAVAGGAAPSPFSEITDEDIDALFSE